MPQSVLESPRLAVRRTSSNRTAFLGLVALTLAVLLIHGYHPFADDAGIYVAGIRKLLNPTLYRVDAPFVLANTHLSLFAHLLAAVVRITHLPLSVVLLATHLASIYLFLLAAWMVAGRLFSRTAERWFAVAFAATCFTLPAAGTALVLMDPYVTSRSFSTPLGLLAVAAALERRWIRTALFLILMGLMHPLMVLYVAGLVLLYILIDTNHVRRAILLVAAGTLMAGLVSMGARQTIVSKAYLAAMHSPGRAFLYPAQWRWYEDLGLIAPLVLFSIAAYRSLPEGRIRKLCLACIVLGASTSLAAFLFVHSYGPYLLIRLQLLRSFHILYLLGALLLGGWLASVFAYRHSTRLLLLAMLAAAATGLFFAQRAAYPLSAHIEWPGIRPLNPWAQAYHWIRQNTPADAIFAADPELVFRDGVDSQGFRATAERSLLADNKDQGVVAVVNPALADQWLAQRNAQLQLDTMTDAERTTRLKPFGATWLLLPSSASTNFPCPYRNIAAKVCRID